MSLPAGKPAAPQPPAINVPGVVLICVGALVAVHAALVYALPVAVAEQVLISLAFVPDPAVWEAQGERPAAASFWSVFTYALLHGDWTHLGINALWLVAFGSPVARRFGAGRFMALSAVAAVAGAGAHWLFHMDSPAPLVGASGAVSAYFGAAARFALRGGLNVAGRAHEPAMTLGETLTHAGTLGFIVVWLGVNLVFGSGIIPVAGQEAAIAWQAHIGGFLVGLLMFPLFDPRRPAEGGVEAEADAFD